MSRGESVHALPELASFFDTKMKTIEKSATGQAPKKAIAPKARNARRLAIKPVSVTVPLHPQTAHPFEVFAKKFQIPPEWLMQSEASLEIECFSDSCLDYMEWIEQKTPNGKTIPVELHFCPETHLLFTRVAQLLRRSVPDLIQGLLVIAAYQIAGAMSDAEEAHDWRDCINTAMRAKGAEELARRNIFAGSYPDKSPWTDLNLKRELAVRKGAA